MIQAEIDAAAELIDFFRFNAKHAIELQEQQPLDAEGSTNTMLYRGLEVRAAGATLSRDPQSLLPPGGERVLKPTVSAGFCRSSGAF